MHPLFRKEGARECILTKSLENTAFVSLTSELSFLRFLQTMIGQPFGYSVLIIGERDLIC